MMMLAACLFTAAAVSCGGKKVEKAPKILVLYYSQTSNTKAVAEEIKNRLGADIEEVTAKVPYDGTFQETIERSAKEREEGAYPEIDSIKSDIASYDVIFLGYPIWFGTYAPPITTLLNRIDLNGKKVVPFCTFGSGGLESSVADLKAKFPEAEVLEGYGVRAARMDAAPNELDRFLKEKGFVEGKVEKLEAFSAPSEVSEEEAAIFDEAVKDYPMISAKAKEVSKRDLPNGVEYLFYAVNVPKAGGPQPPAKEMKVYVLVEKDKAPVFTQVVR